MIRALKRRFIMPCRGSFVFLFAVALIISLILIIHTSRNEPNLLIKNIKEKPMQETNHISASKDGCSEPRCMMKEDCKTRKSPQDLEGINCRINHDVKKNIGFVKAKGTKNLITNVTCKVNPSDKEVYVPFSFIKSYFDIYGELRGSTSGYQLTDKWFSWSHSYSRVFQQLRNDVYSPEGIFESLHAKPVENRDRVKCIDAKYGVPVSSQWKKDGHYYPTQICQFALSYWSKQVLFDKKLGSENIKTVDNKSKGFRPKVSESHTSISKTVYENGLDVQSDEWKGSSMTRVIRDSCVHFESELTLPLDNDKGQQIFSFDLKFGDNVTITVSLKFPATGDRYIIKYVPVDNLFVFQRGNVVYIGYGVVHVEENNFSTEKDDFEASKKIKENSWHRFTRILSNDLMKGISKKAFEKLYKENHQKFEVERVIFEGRDGCVTNVSLSTMEHLRFFFHAADWLLDSQDTESGGWAIQVPFNENQEKYPKAKEINPGWYSAMSQGHALSVLTRAYRKTNNKRYLESAIKGLQLFKYSLYKDPDKGYEFVDDVNRKQIGVSSLFLNQFLWFQEYPTEPNTFVLNGFMYSLIGLYDLWHTIKYVYELNDESVRKEGLEAGDLFLKGMKSLNTLLPMYDIASGSVYDLRHVTMPGVEPKVARWDYHSVHINLLYLLSTIDIKDVKSDLQHSVKKNIPDSEEESVLANIAERWLGYMVGKRSGHN